MVPAIPLKAGAIPPTREPCPSFLSDTEAEFESESGLAAHFVPAKPGEKDPAEGCA
ncbi:hypothetical protein BH09ACT13_BH09ACT13_03600 [soil metagenome]